MTLGIGMTYREAVDFLYGLQWFGIKLGLTNMEQLCQCLGSPETRLRFVHVAGTNGKGSTAATLASILEKAGFVTGLYSSPHLAELTERIRVNGIDVSPEEVGRAMDRVVEAVEFLRGKKIEVTFFEAMTGLALLLFEEKRVEWVVWETGLGGRLDATNVVKPECSVITRIEKDHVKWLGNDLASIAAEKAGIIKQGRPVIAVRSGDEVDRVLMKTAGERTAPFTWSVAGCGRPADPAWSGQWIERAGLIGLTPLCGPHQVENVSLAWSVVDVLRSQGHVISDDAVREGTAATRWPGRFQILSGDPPLVLDGAHNPGAVAVLRRTWDEVFGRGPERIIFGCLAEKLDPEVTRPFLSNDAEIWLVPIGSGRTASREELEALWPGRTVRWFSSSDEAMVRCVEDPKKGGTLVYGSLYLVGEILARNGEGRRETKLNG